MADRFCTRGLVAADDGIGEADFTLFTTVGRIVPDNGYDALGKRSQRAWPIDS